MLQDIAPHKFDNHFVPGKTPTADSPVIAFAGRNVLAHPDGSSIVLPRAKDIGAFWKLSYLFTMDGIDYFFPEEHIPETDIPEGFKYIGARALRKEFSLPREQMFLLTTGLHLANWYDHNRFCGACGHPTQIDDTERALVCPKCGNKIFPRINPAVIVGITNGDELVMTKYANRPGQTVTYYALVAGFTEIGETFEETVQREVMEEVGLKVKNIRYYKSQPWGFADDILAGYFCDVDGDPTITMDRHELKTAVWMKREDIYGQPDDYSLTNEMMMLFHDGKEPKVK